LAVINSALGGLAGFLYWLGIKPKELWGWNVSLAISTGSGSLALYCCSLLVLVWRCMACRGSSSNRAEMYS